MLSQGQQSVPRTKNKPIGMLRCHVRRPAGNLRHTRLDDEQACAGAHHHAHESSLPNTTLHMPAVSVAAIESGVVCVKDGWGQSVIICGVSRDC